MSQAHKGSRLMLSGNMISVDFVDAHFDFNNDATGIQNGNLIIPDSGSIYTNRRYEGKFGGSVAVEAGTINLMSNPFFDNNLGGWSNGNNTNPSWSNNFNDIKLYNGYMYVQGSANGFAIGPVLYNFVSGGTYTVSAYIEGDGMDISGNITVGGTVYYSGNNAYDDYTWSPTLQKYIKVNDRGLYRVEQTFTLNQGNNSGNAFTRYEPRIGVNNINQNFKVYAYQIENKSFSTSISNGNRTNGYLKYPITILNENEGFISFWMYASSSGNAFHGNPNPVYSTGIDGGFDLLIDSAGVNGSNYLRAYISGNSSQLLPNIKFDKWSHVVVYWMRNTKFGIYIDGFLDSELPNPVDWYPYNYVNGTGFYIGSGIRSNPNILISDLRIGQFMPSAEDVNTWYISHKPFFNPYDKRAYAL